MERLKTITLVWVVLGISLIAEMLVYGAQHEFTSFWSNVYVAIISFACGILIENRIKRYIDRKKLLEYLIMKTNSGVPTVVIEAYEDLALHGFFSDGTLDPRYNFERLPGGEAIREAIERGVYKKPRYLTVSEIRKLKQPTPYQEEMIRTGKIKPRVNWGESIRIEDLIKADRKRWWER